MSRAIDQIKPWARHLTVAELQERLVKLAQQFDQWDWITTPAILREACWRLEQQATPQVIIKEKEVEREVDVYPDDPLGDVG